MANVTTHKLVDGAAACQQLGAVALGWPAGNTWSNNWSQVNCPRCLALRPALAVTPMQEEEHTDDSNDTNSILQSSIDAMISTTFKDLPPSSPESDGKFSGAGASETYEVPEASVNPPGSDDA